MTTNDPTLDVLCEGSLEKVLMVGKVGGRRRRQPAVRRIVAVMMDPLLEDLKDHVGEDPPGKNSCVIAKNQQ